MSKQTFALFNFYRRSTYSPDRRRSGESFIRSKSVAVVKLQQPLVPLCSTKCVSKSLAPLAVPTLACSQWSFIYCRSVEISRQEAQNWLFVWKSHDKEPEQVRDSTYLVTQEIPARIWAGYSCTCSQPAIHTAVCTVECPQVTEVIMTGLRA